MKKSIMTKLFATLAMTMTCVAAWAVQPEAGKVYRIVNKAQNVAATDNGPGAGVTCASVSESNSQLWLAEAGSSDKKLYFRSLGTGNYLQASTHPSQPWSTALKNASRTQMELGGSDGSWTLRASGSDASLSMHCDGQRVVVSWSVGNNTNSMWQFTQVEKTQAEIDAALSTSNNMVELVNKQAEFQAALSNMFADKACTTLKTNYQNMSATDLAKDANYLKLPAELQQMVIKVQSGNWGETDPKNANNQWDSEHASKFRVQLYEPFSEGFAANEIVGIQNYTNMNNPTGIVSDGGTVLYVMVDGEIKDGASLYMNGAVGLGMYNDTHSGVELHEGLNVVPCYSDNAHQFIYYTIQTTEDGRRNPAHALSNYDDLKIHIEGGSLNGFFNYRGDALYKADTNADWSYYRDRARHEMFDLVGDYVILHFFFPDTPYNPAGGSTTPEPGLKTMFGPAGSDGALADWDLVDAMKIWDQLCLSERAVMGLQSDEEIRTNPLMLVNGRNPYETREGDDVAPNDIHEYFNNRMMGITMQGNLYMNATTWRTAYNGGTVRDILHGIRYSVGNTWGPAHEYGHMNQSPMKIAGTTEISNNVFSNVAVFYRQMSTSRSDPPRNTLDTFNQGKTFLENGIWGTTRMYLQLWLYYHYCGHNKKFYPRLYKLLKDNPRQQSYYLNHRYDALHFVKMCCIAAQEDLTPFFEAWGFFVPLENYHIGDYSNFMATLTPEDAQAVKDEIAAMNLPKNYQIINIDDRPGSPLEDWADYMAKADCGVLGGLADFINNAQPTGELSFAINGFNIEVNHENGTAGTGFIILSDDGELLGFSNDYSFPINSKAAAALIAGTAKVMAIGADGQQKEVENTFFTADPADRIAELQKLVATVEPELTKVDPTNKKVGFYMEFYAKALQASVANAKAMTADNTADEISAAYLDLITEYNALMNHEYATVRFIPGGTYGISSIDWKTRGLGYNSNRGEVVSNVLANKMNDPIGQWVFESTDEANKYRIKNVGANLYIGSDGEKNGTPQLVSKSKAGIYTLCEHENGVYSIYEGDNSGISLHINTNATSKTTPVIYVENHWSGSKWNLTLIEASGRGAAQARLKQLYAEANELMPKGGTVDIIGTPFALTAEQLSSNAIYSGDNEEDRFSSFNVLLDGDINTYFHSAYGPGAPTVNHRLFIDLGEGKSTKSFQLNWQTRNVDGGTGGVHAPTKVRVRGSNDGDKYVLITTLSDLPSGASSSYLSPVIESEEPYRYICIEVTESTSNAKYFVMSELGINEARLASKVNDGCPAVTDQMLIDIYKALQDAKTVLASNNGNPSEKICNDSYDVLYPAYKALADALGVEIPETSIDEIFVGENGAVIEGIYDLQGRRMERIVAPGIYIVNGKKVLISK